MIEGVDGAPSLDPLRSVAARRARSRNRGIEAERTATEWPEFAPQTSLGDGALGAAQAADRLIARLYAQRARAPAEFCAARPASVDRAQGEPGAMSGDRWAVRPEVLRPVSEWATPEASIALTRSQTRAVVLLEESLTLVTRLPGTLAALEGGLLTPEHLRPLLEHVAPVADDRLRAEIEAGVLRWVAARAARKTITVPGQLGERVLRGVPRRNARDAAQRAVKALRNRGVCRESVRGEGLAGLAVVGTVPEIEALYAAGYRPGAALDRPPRQAPVPRPHDGHDRRRHPRRHHPFGHHRHHRSGALLIRPVWTFPRGKVLASLEWRRRGSPSGSSPRLPGPPPRRCGTTTGSGCSRPTTSTATPATAGTAATGCRRLGSSPGSGRSASPSTTSPPAWPPPGIPRWSSACSPITGAGWRAASPACVATCTG